MKKSRANLATKMAAFALIAFIAFAVIAPAALAARSQVWFSDANGTPQTQWKVGDTLYLTVVAPDENRNPAAVEFIGTPDAAATVKDLLGNSNPTVMIYDPDTKDMESSNPSGTSLVLQETGPNTGIFRSQFGIRIVPCLLDTNGACRGDSGNNSGQLAVINGDTIYARFQDPADASDIVIALGKIASTAVGPDLIQITDKAGNEIPLFSVGQQVFVTVHDPDAVTDPTVIEKIPNVNLQNPRCVAQELKGGPESDQGQPKPCGKPVSVNLTLVETGPGTGVFRNVNGVTLVDTFGPPTNNVSPDVLFINDKDTIVAFYRQPAPLPAAILIPATQTDKQCNNQFCFLRTHPVQVQPGAIFTVTDELDATVALEIAAITDMLPSGLTLVSGTLTTLPQSNVSAGRKFTNTYQVQAGSVPGTVTITGTARGKPTGQPSITQSLSSDIIIGAGGPTPPPPSGGQTAENALLTFTRSAPSSVTAGQTFTVTDTVTAKVDLQIVGVVDTLPAGYALASGSLTSGLPTPLAAGQSKTFTYTVTAGSSSGTISGIAKGLPSSGPSQSVSLDSPISVTGGGTPPPPPPSPGPPPPPPPGILSAQGTQNQANDLAFFQQVAPDTIQAGQTFTVTDTVTAKVDLELAAISDQLSANYTLISGSLTSFPKKLNAGDQLTNSYTVRAAPNAQGTFAITALMRAKRTGEPSKTLSFTNQIVITSQIPTIPQGAGALNDNAKFSLAQAKVGELNPATIQFTDIDGNPKTDFRIGDEFFITVASDDLNTSSDHAETICVQLYDVNGGRQADNPCVEDHGRGLTIQTTGIQLVETGVNTGVFRNPDALKIVGICEPGVAPGEIKGTEYKFSVPQVMAAEIPTASAVNFPQAHVRGRVLKECAPYTPFVQEGLDQVSGKILAPGFIAVHTGDMLYAAFQDQLTDRHDYVYALAHIPTQETYDGTTNQIQFVDDKGAPVQTYKVGQDVFVKLTAPTRNINRDVVDKVEVMVVDLDSGDIENLVLTETGADTGVFMNHDGLQIMPALSKDLVKREDHTLQILERDTIEVHYQDNFNPKDYTATMIRLEPQPGGITPVTQAPGTVAFTDASGTPVNSYAVGDSAYVQVKDKDQAGKIKKAVVITNVRTGKTYTVDTVTETASGSGVFMSDAIKTCATGGGCDIEVENGDQLTAKYTDPNDKTDVSTATVTISSGVFEVKSYQNSPNPFTNTTTFQAVGSSIERVTVWVYDLSGMLVFTNSSQGNKLTWDGTNAAGVKLANGVYLYLIKAEGRGQSSTSDVHKVVLLK